MQGISLGVGDTACTKPHPFKNHIALMHMSI